MFNTPTVVVRPLIMLLSFIERRRSRRAKIRRIYLGAEKGRKDYRLGTSRQ